MAEKQKIRIRLKAYDHEVIDQSTRKIVETVLRTMQGTGAHLARVIGDDGSVVGVVFLEDVIEELVGEVSDSEQRRRP